MIKIAKRIKYYFIDHDISLIKYIYYNFFCSHFEIKHGRVLPHKGTVINFARNSKVVLEAGELEIGFNHLKGSKTETHIRLDPNALWRCKNGAKLFYGTVLEIKKGATFESGFFSANGGSVIIVHREMSFGEDVMIGRNVVIYDSDFHSIFDENNIAVNHPKPVKIEDHVWLTTNVMVQKGVTIGKDSLITAYTVVNKDVPPHSIVAGRSNGKVISESIKWSRATCPLD